MSQVSYGTITITDTTDIERIYVEYCRSTDNQLTSGAVAHITVNWSENTPAWVNGEYIWQRSVVKKSGINTLIYGTPVCLTGAQGTQGVAGRGLTNTVTKYCNYGTGTPADNYSDWVDAPPAYDSAKPNYWVKIINTYNVEPITDIIKYKDEALTQAVSDAAIANSIAQQTIEDAQGAMGQANQALQRVQAKYGTSSTAAATATKVASCEGFQLFNGAEIFIKFTNKNTVANPTLNVNNTGAKSIKDSDGNNLAEQFYWKDNSLVHFVYDGTNWRILDIVTTEKYNNLVSNIDGISQTVGTKASQTDLTNLTTRVSTNETNISQTATSITSLVSNQDTYIAPDGTTKTNTIKSAFDGAVETLDNRIESESAEVEANVKQYTDTVVNATSTRLETLIDQSTESIFIGAIKQAISNNYNYALTTDTTVDSGKTYYINDNDSGNWIAVENPVDADIGSYYERGTIINENEKSVIASTLIESFINVAPDQITIAAEKIKFTNSTHFDAAVDASMSSYKESVAADLEGKVNERDENSSMTWSNGELTILANSASEAYATKIGGNGIEFQYGESENELQTVASINQDQLVINKTVVLDQMNVGRNSETNNGLWSWVYDDLDRGIYLKWIG